jgi:glycosyltransferase involved in cell wall biosynthesis
VRRLAINGWFWERPETGSGQYTQHLVEHVVALAPDLELHVLVPDGGGKTRGGVHVSSLPGRGRGNLSKLWFEQSLFPRACARLEADVAHVPYWAPPLLPRVPTLVTIHDLIPLVLREYRGGPLVRAYTALVSAAAENAALVLTDSDASRQDILAHLDLEPECVQAIPLAVEERFDPTPAPGDDAVRARYGMPARYALYLAAFDVRKNVHTVLEIYTWAGEAIGEQCPLVIAGRLPQQDTRFIPDPRRQARELELEPDWVHFTGEVAEADKPALYRGATAFLFPSRYEGFGLPPLEALACGVPVVGSDTSSLPEVVGDAGVLLDPDDGAGMAGALIQIVLDEEFRARLSRRAVAQANRFSWERTARETLAAYRKVAERSAG